MGYSGDYTARLDTQFSDLEIVGGKGKSLAVLARNGFRVPLGFHVTTVAYKKVVHQNGLQDQILQLAKPEFKDGVVSFGRASRQIAELFSTLVLPVEIESEVLTVYKEVGDSDCPVAVRSSANAEDLPDLSFAGQQETFLNVVGNEQILRAIKKCWTSLWTPQALSYRHQNGIEQGSVAMAVVVQEMVPSDVSGIVFTANPATGERSEAVLNSSYGLGEAVVGGQVTPDTFIIDRDSGEVKQSEIGPKTMQIVSSPAGGTQTLDVDDANRHELSLTPSQCQELLDTALNVERLCNDVPQDIEWAISEDRLYILQSRPITNLPVQPIELSWEVPAPAVYASRRQIVENMPDPICPLFEELYLTKGLESPRKGKSLMVGGGPMFIAINGYAYQRFDFEMVHQQAAEKGLLETTEQDIDAAEIRAEEKVRKESARAKKIPTVEEIRAQQERDLDLRKRDVERFREDLSDAARKKFDDWLECQTSDIARRLTMPESKNPTYVAFNNTEWNNRQIGEWFETTRPRLIGIKEKWSKIDATTASDGVLLEGITEMGIEEGYYWSSNSSHTFGVAKSTDDQLQCFLRETLPDKHFISGQFLTGIESKTMQANADLFEVAKKIRTNEQLSHAVLTTPSRFLLRILKERDDSQELLDGISDYLNTYGHQGYSMDFIEPTQLEEPAGLFATLRAMVQDSQYDPKNQDERATRTRSQKLQEITENLSGLEYWQFRFRLWLARKYNHMREEVAFLFGYTWSVLRPMVFELGSRLESAGTLKQKGDAFFLTTSELQQAIDARKKNEALPHLGEQAEMLCELREARKRHHPPGTLPKQASQIDGIAFKETQILNDESSETMRGFPVSSGRITAPASVITGASEFDKMVPGTILVSPLTTPAWTQLFAHAAGLVTDVGSILAHGSIVAREYGIPAVLGVGNGTIRIKHGQEITIDGDVGTVELHPPK